MMYTTGLRNTQLFSAEFTFKSNKTLQSALNVLMFKKPTHLIKLRNSHSTYEMLNNNENNNSEKRQNVDNDLRDKLIKWAVQNNISHLSFSKLLKILSEHGIKNLPNNSRALLKAREDGIKTSALPPGTYTHFGFETNLKTLVESLIMKNVFIKTEIAVSIFIDNLPLVKFTRRGLWVILGSVEGFTNNIIFIGSYHGYSRPSSANLFLSEFVEEAKHLCTNGLRICNKNYNVKIKRLICDAPAKSFVLNIRDFNGYSSCTKCKTVGEYKDKKISFAEKSTARTDEDFEKDDVYLNRKSNLLEIPNFGVVSSVTLDYMHLVCLGVVRKLLSVWLSDKKLWTDEDSVSQMMKACLCPNECQTKPKSFNTINRWSAKEFRNFLLYLGPVVLKKSLKKDYYQHFLLLHVACRLLCTEASPENIEQGRKLLSDFVEKYKNLYKTEQITHNVHGLYHLADECASHGTLDSFSAFPFEKFLLKLRNTMKKCRKKTIPQIVLKESYDKIFERSISKLNSREYKMCKKLRSNGDHLSKDYTSYEKLSFKNFDVIPNLTGDKYVLLKNSKVIEVTDVLKKKEKSSKTYFVAGKEFTSVLNFYPEPFKSFRLNMFNVSKLSDEVLVWPVELIDKKCMKVPVKDEKSIMIGLLDENF